MNPRGLRHTSLLRMILCSVAALWIGLFSPQEAAAQATQTITVQGVVTDPANQPVIGAAILVEGSMTGATTNLQGAFSINAPANGKLVISSLGYLKQTIDINGRLKIDIKLNEDETMLDDVVVIGYGTSIKADLTGSVGSVSQRQLENRVFTSPEQMLQGLVAGVQVVETSSEPGAEVSIRVRGTNSIYSDNEPLYVIDGYVGASIAGINAGDIKSMDVLKDASATAIYGSRGANGVILITTRGGEAGRTVISFDTKVGFSDVYKKLDMADGQEYLDFLIELGKKNNLLYWKSEAELANIGRGTDWQEAIMQRGLFQEYQLSMRGGSEKTTFSVSGNYLKQVGNIINSDFEKMSMRVRLNHKISQKLTFTLNSNLNSSGGNRATVNSVGNPADGATVLNALRMAPFIPLYDEAGNYTFMNDFYGNSEIGAKAITIIGNPVNYAMNVRNSMRHLSNTTNGILEYKISKSFTWQTSIGTTFTNQRFDEYIPTSVYEGFLKGGSSTSRVPYRNNWLTENTLRFNTVYCKKHSIDMVGGFTYQQYNDSEYRIQAREYSIDSGWYYDIDHAATISGGYGPREFSYKLISFLGRLNYGYDSRYLLTASIRADGSSKFAEGHRWGYFPAAAVAWNAANETFLKGVKWIDQLKLRVSWGVTGNQEIGNNLSRFLYNSNDYNLGSSQRVLGLIPGQIGNKMLEWEKTRSTNVGIDFMLFNGRISATVDAYMKTTYDMLSQKRLPATSGEQYAWENIGDVENKGIEATLTTRNIVAKKAGGFSWETRFNYSLNRNKILRLGRNNEDIFVGESTSNLPGLSTTSVLRVGQPIGSFFGCIVDGVFRDADDVANSGLTGFSPGDTKFRDMNGDGSITEADRVIVGHAYPKFIGSFQNSFQYKGFNLDIFVYGSYGNQVFNLNRYFMENWNSYNKPRYYLRDRWTSDNPDGIYNAANSTNLRQTPGAASIMVEDASFIRLKNLTLGYTLPQSLMAKNSVLRSAKIYCTVDNLYVWTGYKGYDPEVNSFGKSNTSLGTDRGAYPKYRTIVFGLTLGF